jgi:hypothetical protein
MKPVRTRVAGREHGTISRQLLESPLGRTQTPRKGACDPQMQGKRLAASFPPAGEPRQ